MRETEELCTNESQVETHRVGSSRQRLAKGPGVLLNALSNIVESTGFAAM